MNTMGRRRMVKINEHAPTPKGIDPYRHPSQTVRSPNDAGGEVPRGQYRQPVPAPTPAPTLLPVRPPIQKD
jgi:hypothetical protein